MVGQAIQINSTGSVVSDTDNTRIKSITILGGSDAMTLVLKQGGSGGTVVLTLGAATLVPYHFFFGDDGFACPGAHLTITGTAPKVTVVIV